MPMQAVMPQRMPRALLRLSVVMWFVLPWCSCLRPLQSITAARPAEHGGQQALALLLRETARRMAAAAAYRSLPRLERSVSFTELLAIYCIFMTVQAVR